MKKVLFFFMQLKESMKLFTTVLIMVVDVNGATVEIASSRERWVSCLPYKPCASMLVSEIWRFDFDES